MSRNIIKIIYYVKKIFTSFLGLSISISVIISIIIFVISNQPQIELNPDTNYKIKNYFDIPFIFSNNGLVQINDLKIVVDSYYVANFGNTFKAYSNVAGTKYQFLGNVKGKHKTLFFLKNILTRSLVDRLDYSEFKLKIRVVFNYLVLFTYEYEYYFEATTINGRMVWYISNESFRKQKL